MFFGIFLYRFEWFAVAGCVPQFVDKTLHIVRTRCCKAHRLSGTRMVEFKPCRVQALTVDELSVLSKNGAALASIQGITEHGMPYEGHMHAYLVRSAGLKSAYRKGRTVVAFADIPMRYGFARVH